MPTKAKKFFCKNRLKSQKIFSRIFHRKNFGAKKFPCWSSKNESRFWALALKISTLYFQLFLLEITIKGLKIFPKNFLKLKIFSENFRENFLKLKIFSENFLKLKISSENIFRLNWPFKIDLSLLKFKKNNFLQIFREKLPIQIYFKINLG